MEAGSGVRGDGLATGGGGGDPDAVEEQLDDRGRGERRGTDEQRVAGGQDEAAQQAGGHGRFEAEPGPVRLEQRHERGQVDLAGAAPWTGRCARRIDSSCQISVMRGCRSCDGPLEAGLEGQPRVDGGEGGLEGAGGEGSLHGGVDHGVLVGEDPEDRAFGHAGGVGDLPGRDVGAPRDSSGMVAATIAARRSSAGSAAARPVRSTPADPTGVSAHSAIWFPRRAGVSRGASAP